jgi:hypothetical protein
LTLAIEISELIGLLKNPKIGGGRKHNKTVEQLYLNLKEQKKERNTESMIETETIRAKCYFACNFHATIK